MTMILTSPGFAQGDKIPVAFTCDGPNLSPPLSWSGVPTRAESLALIVEDPDAPDPAAPRQAFVHWVMYNLPADSDGLPEGAVGIPGKARAGLNDYRQAGYAGPCPSIGRHRYFYKLYALDVRLPDLGRADKARVERAMQGHVLAHSELVGTYQRSR